MQIKKLEPTYSTNKFSIIMGKLAEKKAILYLSFGLTITTLIIGAIFFRPLAYYSLIFLIGTIPKLTQCIQSLKKNSALYKADIEKFQLYQTHKKFVRTCNHYQRKMYKYIYKAERAQNENKKQKYDNLFKKCTDKYVSYVLESVQNLNELKSYYLTKKDICKNYINKLNDPNSDIYYKDFVNEDGTVSKENIYDYVPEKEIIDEHNLSKQIKNNTNEIISYIDKLLIEYSEIFQKSKLAMIETFKSPISTTLTTEQIKQRVREENNYTDKNEKLITQDPLFKQYMSQENKRKEFSQVFPEFAGKNPNSNFTNPYIEEVKQLNSVVKSMERNDKKIIQKGK